MTHVFQGLVEIYSQNNKCSPTNGIQINEIVFVLKFMFWLSLSLLEEELLRFIPERTEI